LQQGNTALNRNFRVGPATVLSLLTILLAPRAARAWGVTGHRYINRLAVAALPSELQPFYLVNREWITQHSVDPDDWRNLDRTEGPNHFIDMDTWGMDVANNYPQDYWTACGLYGKTEVDKNGIVPWRIGQYYGKLVRAFKARNARDIVETSAWLGHYAADIHVPFHAVANYDGQLTGQKGIHARFESVMVEKQIKFEDLKTRPARRITQPVPTAFEWARESMKLSQPVLAADKEAVTKDAAYGDIYYMDFGAKARPIAIRHLEEGAQDLASLWYSAWLEAGKPALPNANDVHAGEALDTPTHDPDKPKPAANE
jgi:hypothetical protein